MLQIAVCDDMPQHLKRIHSAAEHYFQEHVYKQVKISCFDAPLLFLEYIEKNGGFDIVLLDVCMPGLNGTDVAKIIRKRKDKTEIIFLTTSNDYAVDAFSLKAVHYILKPFQQEQFDEAMDRAVAALGGSSIRKIPLKLSGGGVRTIDICDLIYIESFQHEQRVYMENGETFMIRESIVGLLAQLEELASGQFLTPYKGYLVNLEAVSTVKPGCMMLHGGKTVPIVRRSFRELSERYFAYAFGGGGHGM